MLTSFTEETNPTVSPPPAHQLLHVASEVEAGEGFLLLGIILRSPLGLLLLLTSSLILRGRKWTRRQKEDQGGSSSRRTAART